MTDGDLNSSKQTSTVKWVALGCSGCLGLVVLLAVVIGVFISRTLHFAFDSEDIEAKGEELFTYTLPGGSKGILSMDLLGLQITQVATPDTPPSAILTIGKVPAYMEPGANQESFADTLQEQVSLEGTYQLVEQRTEDRILCDQPITLLVQEGHYQADQTSSDAASYFALVDYNNQTRFAWILAQGKAPLKIADQVFDSLACQ